ncbi:MAG: hypothetical protein U0441_37335 [Polyangiaceae bacterium]
MARACPLLLALTLTACVPSAAPPPPRGDSPPPTATSAAPADSAPPVAAAPADSASPVAPAPEPPKERFDATLPVEVKVAGDLTAHVAHGAVGNKQAIVYLHGRCGDITKFRAWTDAAIHYGTVVALFGDEKCKEGGYKWGDGVDRTDRRILAALRAVSAVRSAPLDLDAITLVGYSQGSARAEALVRRFPARYKRAVLVAGPKEHAPSSFHDALGIAVVAGGRDLKQHLIEAAQHATKAGVRARYFELPGARHGDYGDSAVRVMSEVFAWVYAAPAPAASPSPPSPTGTL